MPKKDLSQSYLEDIANYHLDAENSLRLYFSPSNPVYYARFATYLSAEVGKELTERIKETDIRSSLAVIASIEAAFRMDYKSRCESKKNDAVSIEFRKISKKLKTNRKKRGLHTVRLDEDIFFVWRNNSDPSLGTLISELRRVFKYRHWIAHGRYWSAGNTLDYQTIYLLADTVLASFPLCE
jgi:hypothetical protein